MNGPNTKLRVIWMIPTVLLFLVAIGTTLFTLTNLQGLDDINQLGIWTFFSLLLFAIAIWVQVE